MLRHLVRYPRGLSGALAPPKAALCVQTTPCGCGEKIPSSLLPDAQGRDSLKHHSDRSAVNGSMLAARRAGIMLAPSATNAIPSTAKASVAASSGFTR
jgi:hypothetical protein